MARAMPIPSGDATRHLFFEGKLQEVGGLSASGAVPRQKVPAGRAGDPARRLNLIEAVRLVLEEELAANPHCLVFGEDVGVKGGVHGATAGMQAKFGVHRVFDTSLSEEGIIGRAIGMALAPAPDPRDPVPQVRRPGDRADQRHRHVALADGRKVRRTDGGAHPRRPWQEDRGSLALGER
jgi:hypothetical protein